MSEERKVVCPWCGEKMVRNPHLPFSRWNKTTQDWEHEGQVNFACVCGAQSPIRTSTREAIAAAYATATPPNRPLTREQVEAMDDLDAVWCCYQDGAPRMNAYQTTVRWAKTYGSLCERPYMTFRRLPTPADIAAAREAGKGEGNA